MAFNPHTFETIYGFSFLDELHNFFPELLYDESLFSETFVKFVRYRAKQLFPAAFERQQNLYRIYQASRRAAEAAHWRPPTLPVVTITPTVATTTTTAPPPQGSSPLPTSAAPPSSRRRRVAADPMEELLNALLNPMLTHMTYTTTATIGGGSGASASWQDVPVTATREQIAAGSTLVPHEEVPADTQCAICMDHDSDTTHQWRRLHCDHYFHKSCIDQWFNRNVHCPVCRADIRHTHEDE